MRHLYANKDEQDQIATAKTFERRRCGHHTLDTPLSTLECLRSVVDPNDNRTNKHRYVVASQDAEVRAHMRRVAGVPLIFIKRSVVILEPMAEETGRARVQEERSRFRVGLRETGVKAGKRKREDGEGGGEGEERKKKVKGPKGPNPLSALKPKRRGVPSEKAPKQEAAAEAVTDETLKKKRRRKSSKKTEEETDMTPKSTT
jgi:U3 small nucleolar RNA-associated protein 23